MCMDTRRGEIISQGIVKHDKRKEIPETLLTNCLYFAGESSFLKLVS